eukprot:TCONS_00054987-protein
MVCYINGANGRSFHHTTNTTNCYNSYHHQLSLKMNKAPSTLPKINKPTTEKMRTQTITDLRTNKQHKSTTLPSLQKKPTSYLQQYTRLRSRSEILSSSSIGHHKKLSSNKLNRRSWSTISEESACCTKQRLSLKVPSSPQFRQVLQELAH